MAQSNNCRNHKDFQKALAVFYPPLPPAPKGELPEPVANAGSWQGWAVVSSFRAFYLLLAKPGSWFAFACPPCRNGKGWIKAQTPYPWNYILILGGRLFAVS